MHIYSIQHNATTTQRLKKTIHSLIPPRPQESLRRLLIMKALTPRHGLRIAIIPLMAHEAREERIIAGRPGRHARAARGRRRGFRRRRRCAG
jgi:hypothetical protein